jgi:probable F420-dependent oxidoreductase
MDATRGFRFGVVGTPHGGAEQWRATARRVDELGYSTLVMPDGPQLPSPFSSLALAAGTADIGVGTWVVAVTLRPPRTTAWEAHTLTTLTGGRFEFGIGTGRPGVESSTRELGLPYGSAAERLAMVTTVLDQLREFDGDGPHTPVLVAAGGPRARALAAERADIVTLAVGALAGRDEVEGMISEIRTRAGGRADGIEFANALFVVGDDVPPHVQRYLSTSLEELVAADSLALLHGTPREMADELERRRERFGMSYVTVNAEYMDTLAPVVELLAGR